MTGRPSEVTSIDSIAALRADMKANGGIILTSIDIVKALCASDSKGRITYTCDPDDGSYLVQFKFLNSKYERQRNQQLLQKSKKRKAIRDAKLK